MPSRTYVGKVKKARVGDNNTLCYSVPLGIASYIRDTVCSLTYIETQPAALLKSPRHMA